MFVENIVIGAGPAGLQLGYFFEKKSIPYIIFEKEKCAGSFFTKYPLSGKLISVNKKHTGSDKKDFNLRHDWNSLLSDKNLLFTDYSDDYYPDRKDLVDYLGDFAKECNIKIQYESQVLKIRKEGPLYIVQISDAKKVIKDYTCTRLIVATGLSQPVYPNIQKNYKREIKHYGQFEKDAFLRRENLEQYKNKSVLIIGGGNASYELGNLLTPLCSTVAIIGRKAKNWALSSHYTGDIRSIYLPFMDTFLLKSLNAIDRNVFASFCIDQEKEDSQYMVSSLCGHPKCTIKHPIFNTDTSKFDHVILCTGWKFDSSIFGFELDLIGNDKYPAIKANYESENNSNLFFIGSLMHSHDYKQSSGGFIHGFRYLIKNFMNMNYSFEYDINTFQFEKSMYTIIPDIVNHIVNKINYSSPMYQMYGQIGDFFFRNEAKKQVLYYNNVNRSMIREKYIPFDSDFGFFLTLEYGRKTVTDINDIGRKVSEVGTESNSTLLHPVLTVIYKNMEILDRFHFDEDLFANYEDKSQYYYKFVRILKMFV